MTEANLYSQVRPEPEATFDSFGEALAGLHDRLLADGFDQARDLARAIALAFLMSRSLVSALADQPPGEGSRRESARVGVAW